MSKAVAELERLSQDPDARRLVDEVELARREHGHMLAAATREAREEGIEAGREEDRATTHAIARALLARGMPVEEVAAVTGLDAAALGPPET